MRILCAFVMLSRLAAGEAGQDDAQPPPPAWLHIGGQIRGRFEAPSGLNALNNSPEAYYLSRMRLEAAIQRERWLRVLVQVQDARVAAYATSPAPNTIYNPVDVRQAYAEFSYRGGTGVTVRVGRQELIFGAERLIGASNWGISRSFDAVDVRLSQGRAKVDLFGGSVVLIDPARLDRHKPGEHLYGAYGSVDGIVAGLNVQPYLLFKQTLRVVGERGDRGDALSVTPGVHVSGKTPGRLDYAVEFAVQRGSYGADRISAMAGSYAGGWTVNESSSHPRVSIEFNHASGDHASNDGRLETFDQLYPTNHSYYGIADQVGWRNLRNGRLGFDAEPVRRLKVRADVNDFILATVQDGLYNASGTRIAFNRNASSRHIGWEVDVVALWKPSKAWQFGAGYGRLFPGEYLKQSKAAFGYSIPYVMFVGNL